MPSDIQVTNIKANDGTAGLVIADSTGAVTVSGDLVPSTPLSHRNMVINGAMNVAQRGTSSTSTEYQTVDRSKWIWSRVACTQSQLALTSGDPFDLGFRYAYRIANTSTSTATDGYTLFRHFLEAQDLVSSGWNFKSTSSYITLSFWVRSSLAGTYYCGFRSIDGTEYLYLKAFTLVADTWLKVTMTTPGNSNLTIDNNNGAGMEIVISSQYGTDYTGGGEVTSESWYTRGGQSDAYFANYAQAWMNTASATFDVTGVQLELGSSATPFEHRSYAEELLRCARYFVDVINKDQRYDFGCIGFNSGTTRIRFMVPLNVPLRDTPTVVSAGTLYSWSADGEEQFSSPTVTGSQAIGGTALLMEKTGVSVTTPGSSGQVAGETAGAYLWLDAEL